MRALVTTTINEPRLLRQYRDQMTEDDVIVVAGDHKSPHERIEKLLATLPGTNLYLHPRDQERYPVSDDIGWNCIQRRNIAILEAIDMEPSMITTIDDDNFVMNGHYFDDVDEAFLKKEVHQYSHPSGWYNVGRHAMPRVVHRGYPYSMRHEDSIATVVENVREPRIGVIAGLWFGDPDIDAIERLANRPDVHGYDEYAHNGFTLAPGTWCPFNSQNTTYTVELAPLMFCMPGVGRFDDIWGSYVARHIMDALGWSVHYGRPFVQQDRNEHDLFKDLEQEMLGYRNTDRFCETLRGIKVSPESSVVDALDDVLHELQRLDFLPLSTKRSFSTWMLSLENVL